VTLPNGNGPSGERSDAGYHGNGSVTTALWPYGVVAAGPQYVNPDGSIRMKFPWWRSVVGALRVEGRRLDGRGSLTAEIPDGYGPTGFQATGLVFSSEGCWQITGRAGDASLTFVVMVVRVR
jgi:hypothetical protein